VPNPHPCLPTPRVNFITHYQIPYCYATITVRVPPEDPLALRVAQIQKNLLKKSQIFISAGFPFIRIKYKCIFDCVNAFPPKPNLRPTPNPHPGPPNTPCLRGDIPAHLSSGHIFAKC